MPEWTPGAPLPYPDLYHQPSLHLPFLSEILPPLTTALVPTKYSGMHGYIQSNQRRPNESRSLPITAITATTRGIGEAGSATDAYINTDSCKLRRCPEIWLARVRGGREGDGACAGRRGKMEGAAA